MPRGLGSLISAPLLFGVAGLLLSEGQARDFRVNMMPNGSRFGCATCHVSASGGGSRNAFGIEVAKRVSPGGAQAFWNASLAGLDSDGDGFTNGQELGDPEGDGQATPGATVTNPGNPASKPAPPPPPPLSALVFSLPAAQSISLGWSGGVGPYLLERKDSVGDRAWRSIQAGSATNLNVTPDGAMGFFRVSDLGANPGTLFTAILGGAFEKPDRVEGTGSGSGNFQLQGNRLTFVVHYTGLSGVASGAHIHGPAAFDASAGVMINLASFNGGAFGASGVLQGALDLTTDQKAALMSGNTYVNLHTAAHAGGEIRGQIVPAFLEASISGDSERPNRVNSQATGAGAFSLVGSQLTFHIQYRGLSGAASGAHIHGAAGPDGSAGVMINLASTAVGALGTDGMFEGTVSLTPDQLTAIAGGKSYVNIHSAANPGGEIRGQVLPQVVGLPFTARLNGANERPDPVTTDGAGFGQLNLTGDLLRFRIHYHGLKAAATGMHIHGSANSSGSAGVIIDLGPYHRGPLDVKGLIEGAVTLTATQKAAVTNGLAYVNIHTSAHGGGEIRGQIAPVLLAASLSGAAERPTPVTTTASGQGIVALIGGMLNFNVLYQGLSGVATGAHIHGPADTAGAAGVLQDLSSFNGGAFGTAGSIRGTLGAGATLMPALVDGLTYFNLHTPSNGGGEIRGQIVKP